MKSVRVKRPALQRDDKVKAPSDLERYIAYLEDCPLASTVRAAWVCGIPHSRIRVWKVRGKLPKEIKPTDHSKPVWPAVYVKPPASGFGGRPPNKRKPPKQPEPKPDPEDVNPIDEEDEQQEEARYDSAAAAVDETPEPTLQEIRARIKRRLLATIDDSLMASQYASALGKLLDVDDAEEDRKDKAGRSLVIMAPAETKRPHA